jgi:hypothetical protein
MQPEHSMKSFKDSWPLLVAIAPVALVAIGALLVVPQFNVMFVNFGADLPLSTRIVLATFRWWGVLVLVVVAVWFAWPNRADRVGVAIGLSVALAAALFLFGLYACYAPVFALAAIVG